MPESRLEESRKLLESVSAEEAFRSGSWIDSMDTVIFQKQRSVAFGMSLIIPGGGHFYVLRPLNGLILGLGVLTGLFGLLFGVQRMGCAVLLALAVLTDLIGAQAAFGSLKQGRLAPAGRQIVIGLVEAGAILAVTGSLLVLLGQDF